MEGLSEMNQATINVAASLVTGAGQGVNHVDTIKDRVTGSPGQAALGGLQAIADFLNMAGKLNPEIALVTDSTISLTQLQLQYEQAIAKEGKVTDGELMEIAAGITTVVSSLGAAVSVAQVISNRFLQAS
jgi:hypothetical protein